FCYGPTSPMLFTLSLHDALPIFVWLGRRRIDAQGLGRRIMARELPWRLDPFASGEFSIDFDRPRPKQPQRSASRGDDGGLKTSLDRKSTRLNSSHLGISYAVFCL